MRRRPSGSSRAPASRMAIRSHRPHRPGYDVVFSPNGERVATVSEDGTVKVWDARTGTVLATLTGHTGPVYDVVYSPDGNRVATAGSNGRTHGCGTYRCR